MRVFARDPAGNTARADFDHRTFPKPFKKSQIPLDDKFLDRVVPAHPRRHDGDQARRRQPGEVPRHQRRAAAQERREDRQLRDADLARAAVARRRLPRRSRTTPSSPRSPISAPTSTRARKSTSRCISASTSRRIAGTPIVAAQPRQGPLRRASSASTATASSSITAWACSRSTPTCRRSRSRPARDVEKEQALGRSGMTGLAGGDHLHFTMLRQRPDGEPGRVVGLALDRGPHPAQAARRRRLVDSAAS